MFFLKHIVGDLNLGFSFIIIQLTLPLLLGVPVWIVHVHFQDSGNFHVTLKRLKMYDYVTQTCI